MTKHQEIARLTLERFMARGERTLERMDSLAAYFTAQHGGNPALVQCALAGAIICQQCCHYRLEGLEVPRSQTCAC